MNREIKFRALKENPKEYVGGYGSNQDSSKWVYGSGIIPVYINTYPQKQVEMVVDVNYDELDCWKPSYSNCKILPDSICQYTGLCDSTKWEELSEEEKKRFLSERNFKTGRKNTAEDWRGREIYEGDIMNVTYSDRQGECHHAENYVLDDLRNTSIIGWLDYANELKIVGNIFENPELAQN